MLGHPAGDRVAHLEPRAGDDLLASPRAALMYSSSRSSSTSMSEAIRAFITSATISTVRRVMWSEADRPESHAARVITPASPGVAGQP